MEFLCFTQLCREKNDQDKFSSFIRSPPQLVKTSNSEKMQSRKKNAKHCQYGRLDAELWKAGRRRGSNLLVNRDKEKYVDTQGSQTRSQLSNWCLGGNEHVFDWTQAFRNVDGKEVGGKKARSRRKVYPELGLWFVLESSMSGYSTKIP